VRLGPYDDLPHRPRRVLVNGTSGSGKTTFAAEVERRTGIHQIETTRCTTAPAACRARSSRRAWLERLSAP
jgi:adenylate kinase family enzyme